MKYADYFKEVIAKANQRLIVSFRFEEMEGIIPPIMNKQKWFVFDRYKQSQECKKAFDSHIENLLWVCKMDYSLPFFPVFECDLSFQPVRIEGEKLYRINLYKVYLLDFDLPIEEARKFDSDHTVPDFFSEQNKHRFSTVYGGKYLPSNLTVYKVPVISFKKKAHEVRFSNIEKTVEDKHYLVFKIGNPNDYTHLIFHPPKMIIYLTPNADYFYYIDGKIKHISENGHRIDNTFLQKCERVISLMFLSLSKDPKIFGAKPVSGKEKEVETEMEIEIKTKATTIQLAFYLNISTPLSMLGLEDSIPIIAGIRFGKELIDNKQKFIDRVGDIIKHMWFKAFGEEITFSDDLDMKLKEMEDRMTFLNEALFSMI